VATSFFGGAFFGGEFFSSGGTPTPEQASNWQSNPWKRNRKEEKDATKAERIRLGILPPELREVADEAVRDAVAASVESAAGRVDESKALLQSMEAREAYEQAYRDAYQSAYIAEVVAEHWREDMKRQTRRRKAAMLLLH
jgi:hypothetical protein